MAKRERRAPQKRKAKKPVAVAAQKGKDAAGRFLPGNRFWEARSSHGAKPRFDDGDQLWSACVEYFEWVEANPLWEDRLVTFQGNATHEPAAKMRAMTIAGLCFFLDIMESTWREWRENRSDLSPVVTRAEAVIRDQKFSGAAADLLNPNIIARDLGLAEKQEHTGKDGAPLVPVLNVSVARAEPSSSS